MSTTFITDEEIEQVREALSKAKDLGTDSGIPADDQRVFGDAFRIMSVIKRRAATGVDVPQHVTNNVTHIVADIDYGSLRECIQDILDEQDEGEVAPGHEVELDGETVFHVFGVKSALRRELRRHREKSRKMLREELQALLNTPLTKVGYEKAPKTNHNQD